MNILKIPHGFCSAGILLGFDCGFSFSLISVSFALISGGRLGLFNNLLISGKRLSLSEECIIPLFDFNIS